MATKKTSTTKGQQIAEKARQETNQATDAERERLVGTALRLIYRQDSQRACVNRR